MSRSEDSWSIIVHGGARDIDPEDRPLFARGCREAAALGARILEEGGSALDAAEAAVRLLEDLPQYNAGRGSVTNADGDIEMDAAIMDGHTLALGGVGAIRNVRHPVSVARALLAETPVLLVGEGAALFAGRIGAEPALPSDRDAPAETGCDTVGCVARDRAGHLAAAGSTGGLLGKAVGRVGDTPLPGCGLYADDALGAVAFSGQGEAIARAMLAAEVLHKLSASPSGAIGAALDRLATRLAGEAGGILIAPDGRMGAAHSSAEFSLGLAASWIDGPQAGTDAKELEAWLA